MKITMIKKISVLLLAARVMNAAHHPEGLLVAMNPSNVVQKGTESPQRSTLESPSAERFVKVLFQAVEECNETAVAHILKKVSIPYVCTVRNGNGDTIMHLVMRCASKEIRQQFERQEFQDLMSVQNNSGKAPKDMSPPQSNYLGEAAKDSILPQSDAASSRSASTVPSAVPAADREGRTRRRRDPQVRLKNQCMTSLFEAIEHDDPRAVAEHLANAAQNNFDTTKLVHLKCGHNSVLHWAAKFSACDAFRVLIYDHSNCLDQPNEAGEYVYDLIAKSSKRDEFLQIIRDFEELKRQQAQALAEIQSRRPTSSTTSAAAAAAPSSRLSLPASGHSASALTSASSSSVRPVAHSAAGTLDPVSAGDSPAASTVASSSSAVPASVGPSTSSAVGAGVSASAPVPSTDPRSVSVSSSAAASTVVPSSVAPVSVDPNPAPSTPQTGSGPGVISSTPVPNPKKPTVVSSERESSSDFGKKRESFLNS